MMILDAENKIKNVPYLCGTCNNRMMVKEYRNDEDIIMQCECGLEEHTTIYEFMASDHWCNFNAYGDVHPLEHGGEWVSQVSDNTYQVLVLNHDKMIKTIWLETVIFNTSDSWIDRKAVMSYADVCNSRGEQYALAVVNYYGAENCGGEVEEFHSRQKDEVIALMKERYNIIIEK